MNLGPTVLLKLPKLPRKQLSLAAGTTSTGKPREGDCTLCYPVTVFELRISAREQRSVIQRG